MCIANAVARFARVDRLLAARVRREALGSVVGVRRSLLKLSHSATDMEVWVVGRFRSADNRFSKRSITADAVHRLENSFNDYIVPMACCRGRLVGH